MIKTYLEFKRLPFVNAIDPREKIIALIFAILLNAFIPVPNLFANELSFNLWTNDSGESIYDSKPTLIIDHEFYVDTFGTVVNLDIVPPPSKNGSLFSIVKEKSVFTDIDISRDSAISTHIISPVKPDENRISVSAIHSSKTIDSERYDAVGGLVNYEIKDFIFGAKYMIPFSFDKPTNDNQTQEEKAWGISLKYQVTDLLFFDARYEKFNSNIFTDNISANKQYGFAATYTFSLGTESDLNLTSGYRKIENEASGHDDKQADLDEFLIQLNWGF